MSALFQPFTLKDVSLRNRIAVPPMCQYSANDGLINEWHLANYTSQARGGAGLVIVEATAVSPEGRITPGCAGIWNDQLAEAFVPVVRGIKANGAVPGIQIAHAGRKASANRPWEGDDHIPNDAANGWQTIAPSAIPFGAHLPKVPEAMTLQDIERVKADFVAAARRALAVGFEWLELHFAHGYLAQSFFSPHANQRTDAYGGSADNRSRFLWGVIDRHMRGVFCYRLLQCFSHFYLLFYGLRMNEMKQVMLPLPVTLPATLRYLSTVPETVARSAPIVEPWSANVMRSAHEASFALSRTLATKALKPDMAVTCK